MRLFVQLFFITSKKILVPVLFLLVVVRCGSGAATLEESPSLFAGWGDSPILPSDLDFKKDLASAGNRLPDQATSVGRLMLDAARRDPFVYDGYSPRSPIYLSLPCDLREDRIPDRGSGEALVLIGISHGRSIPFHARYRNRSNCGLVVQPVVPLDMDGIYAVFVLSSQVWQGRLKESADLARLFDDCLRNREPTADMQKRASRFGLRPRETRLALEALRQQGIPSSKVLRLGVFAVRSRGGLYGPFLAIRERYLLAAPPVLRAAKIQTLPRGGRMLSLRVVARDACGSDPCRLSPVSGPGILADPRKTEETDREISVLLRLPDQPNGRIMWIEGPENTAEKNIEFMGLPLIGRLAQDTGVTPVMVPVPPGREPEERAAALLYKIALSRYLASGHSVLQQLTECAMNLGGCPGALRADASGEGVAQLCLRDGDCAAFAFLDPYVDRLVAPEAFRAWLSRPRFENGALPSRELIVKGYVRDLREDLFSPDLYRKWAENDSFGPFHKETHVTKNIFSPAQYDELVEFVKRPRKRADITPMGGR